MARATGDQIVGDPGSAVVAQALRLLAEERVDFVDGGGSLVLIRQRLPILDRTKTASADDLRRGAYVLIDAPGGKADLILIASGSEVELAVVAGRQLTAEGIATRIVSMPSWDLFDAQPLDDRNTVLPPSVRVRLAVEAGASQGWHRYVGDGADVPGVDRFSTSAPGEVVTREYGFTVDNVCERVRSLLQR